MYPNSFIYLIHLTNVTLVDSSHISSCFLQINYTVTRVLREIIYKKIFLLTLHLFSPPMCTKCHQNILRHRKILSPWALFCRTLVLWQPAKYFNTIRHSALHILPLGLSVWQFAGTSIKAVQIKAEMVYHIWLKPVCALCLYLLIIC